MKELDQRTMARARLAVRKLQNWVFDPNVMLVDLGLPEDNGELKENELSVRVHVIQKFPKGPALEAAIEDGTTRAEIPDRINGFDVDVPQGKYTLQVWNWGWKWWRDTLNPRSQRTVPMQGGISISNAYQYGYGTLGGPVVDRDTGARMILSNWHVLAGKWYSQPGWQIYQPGWGDGGSLADTVAVLSRHAMSSNLDAAVAELRGDRQIINNQLELAPIRGVSRAQLGMKVVKSGRKSGITHGLVTGIQGTIRISYSGVPRLVNHVVSIDPRPGQPEVSAAGDSGSLWLDESTMRVIGLHFAGSNQPERALALDIQPVLDALNVDLLI